MAGWLLSPEETSVGEHYARLIVPSFFHAWRDEILRRLDARPGDRFLDVACGTGAVAAAAAALVAPGGEAVGLDASPAMLAAARRRGRARFELGDAHALPFPDASFDLASCPHGLIFFDDPARALREAVRVLRPGGRLVATVWGARERNPHEAALADAFAAFLPEEPDLFRHLFSLSADGALERLAADAGVARCASVERVARTAAFASADAYWRGMVHGRPLASLVARLDAALVRRVRAAALASLRPYARGRGFASPMEALVLTVDKPAGGG